MRLPLLFAGLLLAGSAFAQPRVATSSPTSGAVSIAPDADIVLTFDRPLDRATVTDASVRVFGRWSGPITSTLQLENGRRQLRVTPDRPLMAGEAVTVSLSRQLAAGAASMEAAYTLQFWVASQSSVDAFVVGDWIPVRLPGESNIISYGAYAGDLDGDGDSDLAVPNEIPADVRVFLNDGTGTYGAFEVHALPNGDWPSPSEGADFNHDGRTDIVVGNGRNEMMSVLLGDGAGDFTSIVSYPTTGDNVRGLAVLDADGDGHDDVVTSNRNSGNLSLFLGRGDGSFDAPTTMEPGAQGETALAPGDANGDGILDLFVGAYNSNEILLMLGDGQGGFTLSDRLGVNGSVWMLASGDLDGDGLADVVSASSYADAVETVFSDGDGTLTYGDRLPSGRFTIAVDLGDLDGDGALDIVSSNYITGDFAIYRGNGSGQFTEIQRVAIEGAGSCAVLHDRDGDGVLDITGIDERNDRIYFLERVTTSTEATRDVPRRLSVLGPNPTTGSSTRLRVRLPEVQFARVRVFDALGREVTRLHDGPALSEDMIWNARDTAPGVYLVRLDVADGGTETVRIVRG
ncbi:MAG: FG-GAP-like repeat-containing protein [Bacteroidota bacterium]